MKAYSMISVRPIEPYVLAGLSKRGYQIVKGAPKQAALGDVLVLWNRMRGEEKIADRFEHEGGKVIVIENGYFGELESKLNTSPPYAIAVGGHNGSGSWFVGDEPRFEKFGVEVKPWRRDGEYILVCPNRGIGSAYMKMPTDWPQKIVAKLKTHTRMPVKLRPHPGNWRKRPATIPLASDLAGARLCVIWSSSAGVQALIEGVPVIYGAPCWVCQGAASRGISWLENPWHGDRAATFESMAWAMWTREEIEQGVPFEKLL